MTDCYARIKPGTLVFQDQRFYSWPEDNRRFRIDRVGAHSMRLSAPGFGASALDGGRYGNGPIFIWHRGST